MTHKKMIIEIENDINDMVAEIVADFNSIDINQKNIRHAMSAIEWHKQQAEIDGILELCRSGK